MTTRQIFSLRWNNHTHNLLQMFLEQLANESLVDVTVSCEGKFLKVHKVVLSACSPYFQELFFLHKEQNPIIILNGLRFEDLKSVINFMYCGEIEVAEHQMEGVLAVAEVLKVKGLSEVRATYETRTKQPLSKEDRKEENQSKNVVEETVKSPLLKKRKLEGENSTSSRTHLKKENKIKENKAKGGKVAQSQILETGAKETDKVDSQSDTLNSYQIKEEIIDLDEDIEKGEEEVTDDELCKEDYLDRKGELNTETEPPDNVNTSLTKEDVENLQTDFDGNESSISNAELPVTSNITGVSNSGMSVNEKALASTSMIFGSTARKTIGTYPDYIHYKKIPRPPNAFMVFANEWRRKLAVVHCNENNKAISVRLGTMWKEMPPDVKEAYFAAARRADEEHKIRYPGYTYNPKEARLRKILRQVAQRKTRPLIAQVPAKELNSLTSSNELLP